MTITIHNVCVCVYVMKNIRFDMSNLEELPESVVCRSSVCLCLGFFLERGGIVLVPALVLAAIASLVSS